MSIQWWVIITIGCLPVDEQIAQFDKEVCFLETKVIEAPVYDKLVAEEIVRDFEDELIAALPGSFAIARYEKRVTEKKEDGKGK